MSPDNGQVVLWDANVLIARMVRAHEFTSVVRRWTAAWRGRFATCPITQGSLVRYLVRQRTPLSEVTGSLDAATRSPSHDFWPDDLGYSAPMLARVHGHGDVTDAYLAELARHHHGKLATLDRRLGDLHPDVTIVIPT